jgi:1-acyl-sn-glycerol-3-phosphate acyltransferase
MTAAEHLDRAARDALAAKAELRDEGHGFDRLGLSRPGVRFALDLCQPFYEYWFRVDSRGVDHIPAEGPVIVALNHSGTLPFDALMAWADIVRRSEPTRVPRVVMDHFVPQLPFVGTVFTRGGGTGGSRGNLHALLEDGALVMVCPEGTRGIGKRFSQRYTLQRWTPGHAELAIRHRAPVVPAAVIGAEEQMPQIARIPISLFGAPYVPLAPLLPFPVKYRIRYGAPIDLPADYPASAADDPDAVVEAAERVKRAVQDIIDAGLAERRGIFT